MSDKEEILDQFDVPNNDEKESRFWQFFPALLFLLGFGLNVLHVPGAVFVMAGSMIFASIRLSIRFFRKPRKLFEWSYYLGNIGLMIAVTLSVFEVVFLNFITLGPSMILFFIGILTAGVQKSKNEN